MNLHRLENARIRVELDRLVQLEILGPAQAARLKERYPASRADFARPLRALVLLGCAAVVVGLILVVRDSLNWWLASEAALAATSVAALWGGWWVKTRRSMLRLGPALELVGAIAVQGLVAVLAGQHWTGLYNWLALGGIAALAHLVLAYGLANRWILGCACVNFFFFFGAATGYSSFWGWWLEMTYPLRFLGVGLSTVGLGWLHAVRIRGRWTDFGRVYAHFGLMVANLSLWFLSLFGNYGAPGYRWEGSEAARLAFSLAWAVAASGMLFAGARWGVALLRAYGLTFLVINAYTFYFQFVVAISGDAWFVHLLLVGGSLLGLGYALERRSRGGRAAWGASGP